MYYDYVQHVFTHFLIFTIFDILRCPYAMNPNHNFAGDSVFTSCHLDSAARNSIMSLTSSLCWAIQRSWFSRVNALCNLSRKKSRKVAAAPSGPISE